MEENTNIYIYIYIYYVSPGWQPSATIEYSFVVVVFVDVVVVV